MPCGPVKSSVCRSNRKPPSSARQNKSSIVKQCRYVHIVSELLVERSTTVHTSVGTTRLSIFRFDERIACCRYFLITGLTCASHHPRRFCSFVVLLQLRCPKQYASLRQAHLARHCGASLSITPSRGGDAGIFRQVIDFAAWKADAPRESLA